MLAPWSADCEEAFQHANVEGSGVAIFPLGPRLYLVQVQCDLAAYQAAFNYVLRDERSAPPRNTLLRLPLHEGGNWRLEEWVAGDPTFNRDRNELEILSLARGIGDCGQLAHYGFPDGRPTLFWLRARACRDEDPLPDSALNPNRWPLIPLDSSPGVQGRPGG